MYATPIISVMLHHHEQQIQRVLFHKVLIKQNNNTLINPKQSWRQT